MTTNKRHSPEQVREIERKKREMLDEARGDNMLRFKLWDKQNEEMLGPFTLKDITTYERKPILKKDNRMIEIEEIGPRYLTNEIHRYRQDGDY